jgi:ABC-type branched-subunit amino acid transport system ATPase component
VLTVRDLTVRFGTVTAVDGASLTIEPGRIVGLIGANGAGKTTLLNAISGFVPAAAGSIRFGDTELVRRPPWEGARLGIARGLQDVRLFPRLSVAETAAVAHHLSVDTDAIGDALGAPRSRRAERVVDEASLRALAEVSLTEWAGAPVSMLSSGMLRILELACVGAMRPKLLLLDEPSAGLSSAETEQLAPRLRALRDRTGCGMLVVEHDLPFLARIADEILVMEAGAVAGRVPPSRLGRRRAIAGRQVAVSSVTPPLLEVRSVVAGYGDRLVLHEIDLVVGEGEIVAVLGTNGAGKSTLLRVIAGLLPASAGRVYWRGVDATHIQAHRRAETGIALVPSNRGIFPSLTVAEHLAMGAWLRRTEEDPLGSAELFPRLAERRSQRAGTLSGGEQLMLGIARALTAGPRLLMIDELSAGLAPAMREEIAKTLRALAADGTGVLLVEQDASFALSFCDRAVFIERGAVRFDGAPSLLAKRKDLLRPVFFSAEVRPG